MARSLTLRLTIGCVIALLVVLRQHISVIYEVLYTYTAFPHQHLNTIDYPLLDGQEQLEGYHNDSAEVVPKVIHQIFLDESPETEDKTAVSLDEKYRVPRQSCRELHPGWDFKLWTVQNGTEFVAEQYPGLLGTFKGYPQTIQRTNILRYLLLHHYGGVYLDLDIGCRVALDGLTHVPWLTPGAHPTGINNAFIMSQPRHPFLTYHVIPSIKAHDLRWLLPYVTNMLSTGCMFISSMYARADKADLFILNGPKYFLRGHSVSPLFEHFGESSWHSWDAAAILWVGNNLYLMLYGVLGFLAIALGLFWRRARLSTINRLFIRNEKF